MNISVNKTEKNNIWMKHNSKLQDCYITDQENKCVNLDIYKMRD
jgi:hypothetical protein